MLLLRILIAQSNVQKMNHALTMMTEKCSHTFEHRGAVWNRNL